MQRLLNMPIGEEIPIALATNARRQGRYAAKNLRYNDQPVPTFGFVSLKCFRLSLCFSRN